MSAPIPLSPTQSSTTNLFVQLFSISTTEFKASFLCTHLEYIAFHFVSRSLPLPTLVIHILNVKRPHERRSAIHNLESFHPRPLSPIARTFCLPKNIFDINFSIFYASSFAAVLLAAVFLLSRHLPRSREFRRKSIEHIGKKSIYTYLL